MVTFLQITELQPLLLLASSPLWLKLVWGLAVAFLMGGTDACPLVGGADSNPSGGWGFVTGWD